MNAKWVRFGFAIAAAAAAGLTIHILYGRGLAIEYVQQAAASGRLNEVLREPYPSRLVVLASVTALLPAAGKVLAYWLLQDRLPGRVPWLKGLVYGLLLLLMSDALLRSPIMNFAVGNPHDVVLIQSAEAWLIYAVMGVLIGTIVPPRKSV